MLSDYINQIKAIVDREIEHLLPPAGSPTWPACLGLALPPGTQGETLREGLLGPLRDLVERGGKRLRPVLGALCCEVSGGALSQVQPLLPIPELLHAGTLVIDDVEDGSAYRRGKPALHRLYGVDVALNAGNALYFLPLLVLSSARQLSEGARTAIYALTAEEMLKLHFGQALDIHWHNRHEVAAGEVEYLAMCALKTGTLMRYSAKLGALAGGGGPQLIEVLGRFGETLGVAFQMRDDVLNVTHASSLGKDFGDDIREGKQSYMVVWACTHAAPAHSRRLLEILGSEQPQREAVEEAIEILHSCGAVVAATGRARELVEEAWSAVQALLQPGPAKDLLESLAHYAIRRDS